MEGLNHETYMQLALEQAQLAYEQAEVPVGAVVVQQDATGQGTVVAASFNKREQASNPIYHAELKAIELAAQKLQKWRLSDCVLYVTLEPCLMCAGAIVNSRIPLLVYGASDPKAGAIESLYTIGQDQKLNHSFNYVKGVLETECSELLTSFFASLRHN